MSSTEPGWDAEAVPETEEEAAPLADVGAAASSSDPGTESGVGAEAEAEPAESDEAAEPAGTAHPGDSADSDDSDEPADPTDSTVPDQPDSPESQDTDQDGRADESAGASPVVQDGAADQLDLTVPTELDRGAIEAILLVTDEPLQASSLAEVLEQPVPRVAEALRELADEYTEQHRGFELREVAGGWRLYTREEYATIVEKFVLDGQQAKLTQAALETLAVVAYRQPVSRARVSAIRGVNCDGVMKTLVARGLITEAGSDHESGATLFATTGYFLERLGLGSLDDLPDLAPYLPDIDEMEELAAGMGGGRSEPVPTEQQATGDQPAGDGTTAEPPGDGEDVPLDRLPEESAAEPSLDDLAGEDGPAEEPAGSTDQSAESTDRSGEQLAEDAAADEFAGADSSVEEPAPDPDSGPADQGPADQGPAPPEGAADPRDEPSDHTHRTDQLGESEARR